MQVTFVWTEIFNWTAMFCGMKYVTGHQCSPHSYRDLMLKFILRQCDNLPEM